MTPSFFTSFFLFTSCHLILSSSFENSKCGPPQLECPKVTKANKGTWHPKVAKANNTTWHPKAIKSNNVIVNVFYNFLSLQFSSCQSYKTQWSTSFSFGFHLYIKDRKITAPILLVTHGHVRISNLSMLLFLFHFSSCIYFDVCPPYRK